MYDVGGQAQASGLSFRRLATIGRRQWWVVVGCVVLAAAGAVGYGKTKSVTYTAVVPVTVATPTYVTPVSGVSGAAPSSTAGLLVGNLSPTVEVQAPAVR